MKLSGRKGVTWAEVEHMKYWSGSESQGGYANYFPFFLVLMISCDTDIYNGCVCR